MSTAIKYIRLMMYMLQEVFLLKVLEVNLKLNLNCVLTSIFVYINKALFILWNRLTF